MSTGVKKLYSSNNYCNQTLYAQHCVYKSFKKELKTFLLQRDDWRRKQIKLLSLYSRGIREPGREYRNSVPQSASDDNVISPKTFKPRQKDVIFERTLLTGF